MPKKIAHIKDAAFNPRVVALVYEGLCAFEFACAAEVFGLARPELTADVAARWYQFQTASMSRGALLGQYGQTMVADAGLEAIVDAGTVIIPGWQGANVPVPAVLIKALHAAHASGARILTICSGAFVLAATGLLDGKRAATHWQYAAALQAQYPAVRVDDTVLYVDGAQLLTSAGSAAGLDLSLHLVRRDFGAAVANLVARRLVVAPHRDGGQAQFLQQSVQKRERNALSPLLGKLHTQLKAPLTIEAMAGMALMSERSFMRHFKATTGLTPLDWLSHARVQWACEWLETSNHSIDLIASETGLGTGSTLRHHFKKIMKISPSEYRARFKAVA